MHTKDLDNTCKRYLIIGGNGFIGGHLCDVLEENKEDYYILSQTIKKKGDNTFYFKYEKKNFISFFNNNQFQYIYYLSGVPYPPISNESFDIEQKLTIQPLLNCLESLVETNFKGKFFYGSSVAVYGNTFGNNLSETSLTLPISNYGLGKLICENLVSYFTLKYKLRSNILRIFSTYGPSLERQVVYDIIIKMLQHDFIRLNGNNSSRDLIFVKDLSSMMYLLSKKDTNEGEISNLGSGNCYSVKEIIEIIKQELDWKGIIEFSNKRNFDGDIWGADISKINQYFKIHQKSIAEGIKETIKYIKEK